ncbi:MAG: CBS domain-containing protein [Sporomusaceae bacterium]|nr:CBS domain-containing protein [Sporomusaceae bacterium]
MAQVTLLRDAFFSQIIGTTIYDVNKKQIGKVLDLVVSWNGAAPIVTCVKFTKGLQKHLEVSQIDKWDDQGFVLNVTAEEMITRPILDQEIFVGKWLLDKQIIDLSGAKLVRVNDIQLSWVRHDDHKEFVLISIDIGLRGLFRRLGLEFLLKNRPNHFVSWQHITPLENRLANLHLRESFEELATIHPADIAEIIEDLDHHEQLDFVRKLGSEQAADVLTEVDLATQVDIIESLDVHRASDILEEMPADEAADILGELPAEKSDEILKLMEPEDAEDVRDLMEYPDEAAGSLMTTEFPAFSPELTASEAICQLREIGREAETITYLYMVDKSQHLLGVLSLRELIIAAPNDKLGDVMHVKVRSVMDLDNPRKALDIVMKYGVVSVPVINKEQQLVGIITVDDLLYTFIPDRSNLRTFSNFMLASRKEWMK